MTREQPSLVVIGNFDGVHRGHRAVIESALVTAQREGSSPRVLTFDPHPSRVLGGPARPALTLLDRKVELLLRMGPALTVVVEPFTLELSRLSPAQFSEQVLVNHLAAKTVIVGENFRFGQHRSGDLATLRQLGERFGFEARAEPLVRDAVGFFSSTRARRALELGDLGAVQECLGRPHSISGRVIQGAQRGRTIGFPTANLYPVQEALPPFGVYACLVDRVENGVGQALARGVMNLGIRPTLDAGFSVEVHLFDFSGDLYGAELRVHLISRLREERKFDGLNALREQIDRDAQSARSQLAACAPDLTASGAWF